MTTYTADIRYDGGRRDIVFSTAAKTRNGLLRACARAIVDTIHTDIFELLHLTTQEHGGAVTVTPGIDCTLWRYARDYVFDLRYYS